MNSFKYSMPSLDTDDIEYLNRLISYKKKYEEVKEMNEKNYTKIFEIMSKCQERGKELREYRKNLKSLTKEQKKRIHYLLCPNEELIDNDNFLSNKLQDLINKCDNTSGRLVG